MNECKTRYEKDLIMNVTIPEEADSNIEKLILFLYASLGRPNKNTLIQAIQRGHLATRPGLTVQRVKKNMQGNIIHTKDHMLLNRQVKNRKKIDKIPTEIEKDINHPIQEKCNVKTNLYFSKIEETGLCGTDLTGKYPIRFKQGNK